MKEIGRGILLEQGGGWIKLHRVSPEDAARIETALEAELCHQVGRNAPVSGKPAQDQPLIVWLTPDGDRELICRALSIMSYVVEVINPAPDSQFVAGKKPTDTERLDFLECEPEIELIHGAYVSIFRRNLPIIRETIDQALRWVRCTQREKP